MHPSQKLDSGKPSRVCEHCDKQLRSASKSPRPKSEPSRQPPPAMRSDASTHRQSYEIRQHPWPAVDPPSANEEAGWECARCTLINTPDSSNCVACYANRQAPASASSSCAVVPPRRMSSPRQDRPQELHLAAPIAPPSQPSTPARRLSSQDVAQDWQVDRRTARLMIDQVLFLVPFVSCDAQDACRFFCYGQDVVSPEGVPPPAPTPPLSQPLPTMAATPESRMPAVLQSTHVHCTQIL